MRINSKTETNRQHLHKMQIQGTLHVIIQMHLKYYVTMILYFVRQSNGLRHKNVKQKLLSV